MECNGAYRPLGRKALLAFDVLFWNFCVLVRRLRAVRLAPAAGLASSPEISGCYPREGREIPRLVVNKLGVLDSGPSSRRVSETSLIRQYGVRLEIQDHLMILPKIYV